MAEPTVEECDHELRDQIVDTVTDGPVEQWCPKCGLLTNHAFWAQFDADDPSVLHGLRVRLMSAVLDKEGNR